MIRCHLVGIVDGDTALNHQQRGIILGGKAEIGRCALTHPRIHDMHRRKGAGGTTSVLITSGDHLDIAAIAVPVMIQTDLRHFGIFNILIFWRRHFVLGRQIDPELHHLEITALPAEIFFMKFLVQNT